MEAHELARETARSLGRILPRIEAYIRPSTTDTQWAVFRGRLEREFPRLFRLLVHLYGSRYDFFFHLEHILLTAGRMWLARSAPLRDLDAQREADPTWFASEQTLGGVCYVDRFANDLAGIRRQIPYFKELGLSYLHLMPLFTAPEGNSDGGYAVSSYREVDPRLGTMAELAELASELRANGISLVLDFVFNHTSDEHIWAQRARSGDPEYVDFYYIFPDRTMPDAYDRTLREIFPDQRSGSFSYLPDVERWVWTTFNDFQWDLNYANPSVFAAMAEEMLFLANQGVEILRLDAIAFIWKQLGTSCENLPEAHILVQAFNTVARIAAPALLFKSEAIVHPDEVLRYISAEECQLSYNPLLMALLWEALATREVSLLRRSLQTRQHIDARTAWVNYVRCHDDIGWTFDDVDAQALGISPSGHRRFLNDFYTGRFPGSFASGLPFQENPRTGDARISGTGASLAGLERAIEGGNEREIDNAIKRILLIHGIILSIGGVPLIYLGDEWGMLNDYGFRDNPAHAADSRWVHRPAYNAELAEQRSDPTSIPGRVYCGLRRLIAARAKHQSFAGNAVEIINIGNSQIFAFTRRSAGKQVLVLANFSERPQQIPSNQVRIYGLGYSFTDLISNETINLRSDLHLGPYQMVWLA